MIPVVGEWARLHSNMRAQHLITSIEHPWNLVHIACRLSAVHFDRTFTPRKERRRCKMCLRKEGKK